MLYPMQIKYISVDVRSKGNRIVTIRPAIAPTTANNRMLRIRNKSSLCLMFSNLYHIIFKVTHPFYYCKDYYSLKLILII